MGIGPSTKETTLHHFRDPLVEVLSADEDFDFAGILVVGTPQINEEKLFVGSRAAVTARAMNANGAILSADGWGNSDVDFASTYTALCEQGIQTVGLKFIGTAGQFVVASEALDTVLDINKSKDGIETEVVGENSITLLDARKAAAALKLKLRRAGK